VVHSRKRDLQNRLIIDRTLLEDKRKLALQGKLLFQEFEQEMLKLDVVVTDVTEELARLEVEVVSVQNQLLAMKNSGGASLWPKPILHPSSLESELESDKNLHIRPCSWCRRGFHCYNIAVASCKHLYHPFCLVEAFKESENCISCKQQLHPDWWAS
jgi:hypothetical protein